MVASFLWNDPFGQLCCVFESLELAVFVLFSTQEDLFLSSYMCNDDDNSYQILV